MMPLPVGVSVATIRRSNASWRWASVAHSSAVRRLPAVQTCRAMSPSTMIRSKSRSGMAVGPPFTWNDTCGFIASKWSPVIAPGARDRGPAGVTGGDHAVRARRGDQRRIFERGLEGAEAGLGEPHALLRDLTEVVAVERRLENDGAGVNLHSARAGSARSISARRRRAPSPLRHRSAGRAHGLPRR